MKKSLLLFSTICIAFISCKQNQYATSGGKYETDEVYYQPSDTYISDFALVDDEERMGTSSDYVDPSSVDQKTTQPEEDYYSGDTATTINSGTINNYYGNTYQSPWNNSGCGNYGGFGNYQYGSLWNSPGPRYSIGWSPYSGWYSSFNFGYSWGYNPWYSPYYNNFYSWYTPYYNPWYYNQWGYNTWYSPYNYYNPYYGYNNPYYNGYYNGGFWSNNDDQANVVFGHRNPIATGSEVNSTYGDDVFYSGKETKPFAGNQPALAIANYQNRPAPFTQTTTGISSAVKPIGSNENNVAIEGSAIQSKPVMSGNVTADDYVSKPNNIEQTNQTVFKPQTQVSVKPRPTYTSETTRQPVVTSGSHQGGSNVQQHSESNQYRQPTYSAPSEQNTRRPASQQNDGRTENRYTQPTYTAPSAQPSRPQNEQPARVEPKAPPRQEQRQPAVAPKSPPSNHRDGGFTAPPPAPSRSTGGGGNHSGGSISGPRRK
jgi:hypothetical protein